nr:hypothetical secreted protein [uncultured archaeon]
MRKQCIVAILAILFSVIMASTAVPFGLPDSGEIPEEVPEIHEEVPVEVPELPDELRNLTEELPSSGHLPELIEYRHDLLPVLKEYWHDLPKHTPSVTVRMIENQGMELTDEYGIMRIGENGSVVTNITEETGYRWAIGNNSIKLIGDENRKISPEDLKELIGANGIVLVYTWRIGNEGIELIGENGTVPPGDLQGFMENHSFYLIGTTPINDTAEENEETDSTVEESEETDSTMEEKETTLDKETNETEKIATKQEQEEEIP